MNKTILIIPAFNESLKIENVIKKVNFFCHSVIDRICVIDDCSLDDTAERAAKAGAFVLKHDKNYGVGAAIRTGLDYGFKENYEIAVIISGDDQHDPQEMTNVLNPILNEEYDFVQGSRFIEGGKTINQPIFRKVFTKIYPVIFTLLTGKYCSDITNGFRAFRIKNIYNDPSINLHQVWLNRYELEVYLIYKVYNSKKYRKKEAPISVLYHSVTKDRTKMKPISDWWRIFRPLILLRLGMKK